MSWTLHQRLARGASRFYLTFLGVAGRLERTRDRGEARPLEKAHILAVGGVSRIAPLVLWGWYPGPVVMAADMPSAPLPLGGWAARKAGRIAWSGPVPRHAQWRQAREVLERQPWGLAVPWEAKGVGDPPGAELWACLLAIRSGCPIVPACLAGARSFLGRGARIPTYVPELPLRLGPSMDVEAQAEGRVDRKHLRALAAQVTRAIDELGGE